jgi:ribonuclease P protein component
MLPTENSLTKSEDFEKVKSKGKLLQSNSFALAIMKRDDEKPSRFGFVVSTKISKQATLRNRVKRALRESIRQSLYYLPKEHDFVFLAKGLIVKMSTPEIMREVQQFLKDNNLTK